ncbi:MAG: hypothetical protein M1457_05305 [bacterium]|nr:hypothetical protein [bacterium]
MAVYGGTMVWNNSEIGTADGGPAATGLILASVPAANPSTSVTFNDCLVAPGRPADGVAQGGRWVGGAGQMGPLTMTLNRCTLGYTFEVACRIPNGLQVTVAGTPTAKTSIDPMINRSTTSPPCVLVLWSFDQANSVGRSGALTLRDVMGTTYPNAPNQLFRHAGADQMTDNLTVERCYFENCAAGNGAFAQSAGPGLNATFINTILKGPFNDGLSGGVFFLCNAGTLNLNMTHCTLIGANPVDTSLMRFFNTTTQGFVNADYCIFDDRQMGTGYGSNNLKGLFGKISMVCAGSNFGQPIPTDWIVGTAADPIDPKLTATGRLTDLTSPAIGGAVGEMVQGAIDIDGNSRPLTKSDLGASQTPFPNASSGWAEFR